MNYCHRCDQVITSKSHQTQKGTKLYNFAYKKFQKQAKVICSVHQDTGYLQKKGIETKTRRGYKRASRKLVISFCNCVRWSHHVYSLCENSLYCTLTICVPCFCIYYINLEKYLCVCVCINIHI